jgi:hypothetical protein
MRPNQWVDSGAELTECPMRACLILTHQPTETDYVGVQNTDELPLPRTDFRDFSHQRSQGEMKHQP